jgi:hypothetical protein
MIKITTMKLIMRIHFPSKLVGIININTISITLAKTKLFWLAQNPTITLFYRRIMYLFDMRFFLCKLDQSEKIFT